MQQTTISKQTLAIAKLYKSSMLATVSLSVLILASNPTQASIDPTADDPFGDLEAISTDELADLRGGFVIETPVGLLDIGIGISSTVVNSVAGLDNLGEQISAPLENLGPQITQAVNDAVFEAGGQPQAANAAPPAQSNASSNSAVANANAALGAAIDNAIGSTDTTQNPSSSTPTTTTAQGGETAGSAAASQSAVTSLTALDTPAQGAVSAAPEPPADLALATIEEQTSPQNPVASSASSEPAANAQALASQGTTRITNTGPASTIIENTRDNVAISRVVSLNLRFQDLNRMTSMNATRNISTAVQSSLILFSLR